MNQQDKQLKMWNTYAYIAKQNDIERGENKTKGEALHLKIAGRVDVVVAICLPFCTTRTN